MGQHTRLADFDNPVVQETAHRITGDNTDPCEKLGRIFDYVRDQILFGFPADGDFVAASQTIRQGYGQCNTKATLFLALCKAVGLSARIHFSLISKNIQKGFFTGLGFWLMPREISHSWIEVEIDGDWQQIDGFINDARLHEAAERVLRQRGWTVGYSLALEDGKQRFEQMAAVTQDHGVWDEPAEYYQSPLYKNRPGALRLWVYRRLIDGVNRRVRSLRSQAQVSHATVAGHSAQTDARTNPG